MIGEDLKWLVLRAETRGMEAQLEKRFRSDAVRSVHNHCAILREEPKRGVLWRQEGVGLCGSTCVC